MFTTGLIVISEAMTFRPKSLMDIDIDSSACNLLPLKRYNSAPYINCTVAVLADANTSTESMTQTIDTVAR